jgi:hypothetical protein
MIGEGALGLAPGDPNEGRGPDQGQSDGPGRLHDGEQEVGLNADQRGAAAVGGPGASGALDLGGVPSGDQQCVG